MEPLQTENLLKETNKFLICKNTWPEKVLATKYPGKWKCKNKVYVLKKIEATPTGDNDVVFSRYREMPLPRNIPGSPSTKFEELDITYDYQPNHWYVNFADAQLFGFYGGTLLAQDELQVLEHPGLGSLRECLLKQVDQKFAPKTRENSATPALVRGIERRLKVSKLYGSAFAEASTTVLDECVSVINPPTISNIVAMEAPKGSSGAYTMGTINFVLGTAYTAFRAVFLECKSYGAEEIVIHSGFWGCGAYGGNKVIMITIQMLAAVLAGIDRIVFHTLGEAEPFKQSNELFIQLSAENSLTSFLHSLEKKELKWGLSNGT